MVILWRGSDFIYQEKLITTQIIADQRAFEWRQSYYRL